MSTGVLPGIENEALLSLPTAAHPIVTESKVASSRQLYSLNHERSRSICPGGETASQYDTVHALDVSSDLYADDYPENSSVAFDASGRLLAIGDSAGTVSILGETETQDGTVAYSWIHRWDAFQTQVDPLNSNNIAARCVAMRFVDSQAGCMLLLTANERMVRLWRAGPTQRATLQWDSFSGQPRDGKPITFPSRLGVQPVHVPGHFPGGLTRRDVSHPVTGQRPSRVVLRQEFGPVQDGINSVGVSADGESVMAADPLTISLWDLGGSGQRLTPIALVAEVGPHGAIGPLIYTASMHPTQSSCVLTGFNHGALALHDLRAAAQAVVSMRLEPPKNTIALLSSAASICHASFGPDPNLIAARTPAAVHLWDVRSTAQPVGSVSIPTVFPRGTVTMQPSLDVFLPILAQNDLLERRLDVVFSARGDVLFTGGYRGDVMAVDLASLSQPDPPVTTLRTAIEPEAQLYPAQIPPECVLQEVDLTRFVRQRVVLCVVFLVLPMCDPVRCSYAVRGAFVFRSVPCELPGRALAAPRSCFFLPILSA